MTPADVCALVVVVALLGYLVVALLRAGTGR